MGPLSMAAVNRSTIDVEVEGDENDAGGGGGGGGGGSGVRSNSVTLAPGAVANVGGGKGGDSTTAAAAAVPVTARQEVAAAAEVAAAKAAALALTNMPDEDLVYGIGMDAGCGQGLTLVPRSAQLELFCAPYNPN